MNTIEENEKQAIKDKDDLTFTVSNAVGGSFLYTFL